MVKAIIFDFGGVLLIYKNGIRPTYTLSKRLGIDYKLVQKVFHKYWRQWRVDRITEEIFYHKLSKDLGIKCDPKQLKSILDDNVILDSNVLSLVEKLKMNYAVFYLTNHARERLEYLSGKLGFDMGNVFTSYNLKAAKPDQEIYQKMLRKIGYQPEECLFIDDKELNIAAAKRLGFNGIVYKNAKQLENELTMLHLL